MSDIIKTVLYGADPQQILAATVPDTYRAAHLRREDVGIFDEPTGVEGAASDRDVCRSLRTGTVPMPELAGDEVLVAVMAAAVNFNTVWSATHQPMSTFQFLDRLGRNDPRHTLQHHVLGSDAAGIVVRVGGGVRRWAVGDRVVINPAVIDPEEPAAQAGSMISDVLAWAGGADILVCDAHFYQPCLMPSLKDLHRGIDRERVVEARDGLALARSTICGWHEQLADLAEVVVDAMLRDAFTQPYLCTDATGVLVQAEEQCRKAHFWVLVAPERHVLYRYSHRHDGEAVDRLLAGYKGHLVNHASRCSPRRRRDHDAVCRTDTNNGLWTVNRGFEAGDRRVRIYSTESVFARAGLSDW